MVCHERGCCVLLLLLLLLMLFATEALCGAFVCFVLSKLVRSALTAATSFGFAFGLGGSCLLAVEVDGLELALRFTAYGLTALETVIVDDVVASVMGLLLSSLYRIIASPCLVLNAITYHLFWAGIEKNSGSRFWAKSIANRKDFGKGAH